MLPQPAGGQFLPDDSVAGTLVPVLRRMSEEQRPVLQSTAARLSDWRAENPESNRIPRTLGWHRFRIGAPKGSAQELAGVPGAERQNNRFVLAG